MDKNKRALRSRKSIRILLESYGYFHDWYIASIYIANSGENIVKYSHPGLHTVQIVVATSNNEESYTLVFSDVYALDIRSNQNLQSYTKHFTFTGFERIYSFSVDEEIESSAHRIKIECESDSRIVLTCRKMSYRRNHISIYK